MNFELEQEHQMLKDIVARFVREELVPLEPALLVRESEGHGMELSEAERTHLNDKAKEIGLMVVY